MSLSQRIREQRKARGLSQEKLAELAGVSRQAVTKWESGQSAPSTENLFKLAEILGTTVDMLLASDEEAGQTPAEQIYYLYKLEREKQAAERRARLKRNIRLALIVFACYLLISFLGRLLYGTRSSSSLLGWLFGPISWDSDYLFSWLVNRNMLWYSAAVSSIPALFGKFRFSFTTVAGFTLGLLLGQIFGYDPGGAKYGQGHYGWAIWGGVFLFSILMGAVLQRLSKKSLSLKTWNTYCWGAAALAGIALVVLLVLRSIPRYPQPEYSVDYFWELAEAMEHTPQCVLPEEDLLSGLQGHYTVYVESRFSDKPAGYHISFEPAEGQFDSFSITCTLLTPELEEQLSDLRPTEFHNSVGLNVTNRFIAFETGGCRYDFSFPGASSVFEAQVEEIARNIIDRAAHITY